MASELLKKSDFDFEFMNKVYKCSYNDGAKTHITCTGDAALVNSVKDNDNPTQENMQKLRDFILNTVI